MKRALLVMLGGAVLAWLALFVAHPVFVRVLCIVLLGISVPSACALAFAWAIEASTGEDYRWPRTAFLGVLASGVFVLMIQQANEALNETALFNWGLPN